MAVQATMAALATDLLRGDLPDLDDAAALRQGRATAAQVLRLPGPVRLGVLASQALVTAAAAVVDRDDRPAALQRLARGRVPLVADYLRLLRGVALVVHHDDVPDDGPDDESLAAR